MTLKYHLCVWRFVFSLRGQIINLKMNKNKKNNPKWMKYWDNVNVELYALIKQTRNEDRKNRT